ncbi:hypothetical protein [Bdellovibrio bacteriovorus]|uniref:hypothetical protein n=1 Tax=Bdellovibrio TaxID=958 RepID=UPI0035A8F645
MKLLGFIATIAISVPTLAAKFAPIANVNSVPAQKLAAVVQVINQNEQAFGDAGNVSAYVFSRKATETDAKTVKQMSFAKGGANTDDDQRDFQNTSVSKIVEFALYAVEIQDQDYEAEFKSARENLTKALTAIKADPTLKIYGSGHADEDGSWQILYIIDTKTSQVLMVTIGFHGT